LRRLAASGDLGCSRWQRSTNRKKTPGPKQSSMTEMPVAMPQKVPAGAASWLGGGVKGVLPKRTGPKTERGLRQPALQPLGNTPSRCAHFYEIRL